MMMSQQQKQKREENSEVVQGQGCKFVRNSKLRQSIRIKNRTNQLLPPSALIYMKHLEKNIVKEPVLTSIEKNIMQPETSGKIKENANESLSMDVTGEYDDGDDTPLINIRRNSKRSSKKAIAKKSSAAGKKHKSLNRFLNFFR